MNFSNLPNLSGTNWGGLSGENLSGLSGLNLSGLNGLNLSGLSGLGNFNFNFSPGAGGCGFACYAFFPPQPPPCDLACQQAKLVLHNENEVLAKPHENPAITQAQLDARRYQIEKRIKTKQAYVANTNASKYANSLAALKRNFAAQSYMPSGNGAPPSVGGGFPTINGCPSDEQPSSFADGKAADDLHQLAESGGNSLNRLHELTTPQVHVPPSANTTISAPPPAGIDFAHLLGAAVVAGYVVWWAANQAWQWFKQHWGWGGQGGGGC